MCAHAEPNRSALTTPGDPHLRHDDQRSAGAEGLAGRPAGHVGGLEATGDYWRGVYYLLEDTLNVILVNPAHAKGLPGPKTDVSDSAWLAQLGECGLLKASFVPPEPIRHLRDLTRYRKTLTVERTREAQRLEKELEDAGIKISSVATDILGVSGRAMLTALIEGEDDAQVMAEMARGRMRPKIPALVQALTGNFGEHHSFLCRMHLTRIDELSATIEELSARIDQEMRPFAPQIKRLVTIPGVKKTTAEVIIAETGADMTRFRTPANLASWAGVCPGHHESAGRQHSGSRLRRRHRPTLARPCEGHHDAQHLCPPVAYRGGPHPRSCTVDH